MDVEASQVEVVEDKTVFKQTVNSSRRSQPRGDTSSTSSPLDAFIVLSSIIVGNAMESLKAFKRLGVRYVRRLDPLPRA